MKVAELEVRAAGPADLDPIVDLIGVAMGPVRRFPFTREYWRWKHEENPFGRSPCLVALDPAGQVVAVRAFMRWEWQRGPQRLAAVRAVDTAVHPRWQGAGLFTRLTRALLAQVEAEGVGFVFNTPNGKSLPGYLKMGWRAVARPTLWVRALRPLAALRALVLGGATSPSALVGGDPCDALLDDPGLPALCAGGARLATARDREFLRWRYVANPTAPYRAWARLDGAAPAALVGRTGARGGLREALVCELLLGPSRRSIDTGRRLLGSFCADVDADYAVACAMGDRRAALALAAAGFVPVPGRGPMLTARALAAPEGVLQADAWRLSIGDLELF